MTFVQWNDHLSVRVAEIDRQHQQLLGAINRLAEAITRGKGSRVVGDVLQSLKDYATTHFRTEEAYFEKFGYPDTDRHKKEHTYFIEKVSTFETGPADGNLGLTIQVLQFLSDWLIHHILETDKAYTSFFHEKGVR